MLQYDLRFRKTLSSERYSNSPRKRKRAPGITNLQTTLPTLSYPEYYNQATVLAGLDVDVESGVIAAAQEEDTGNDCVQLFSLHGGNKLESRIGVRCNDLCLEKRVVRCVQFVRDDRSKMKSLWFMSTRNVELHRFALDEEEYTAPRRLHDSRKQEIIGQR